MRQTDLAFPATEECIKSAEAEIGRRLPEAYRQRLLRDNGGEVRALNHEWRLHPVWDPTNRKTVKRTANHILKETASAKRWHDFPEDAVALGSDGCGNILISRSDENLIEFWDHETGELEPVEVDWN